MGGVYLGEEKNGGSTPSRPKAGALWEPPLRVFLAPSLYESLLSLSSLYCLQYQHKEFNELGIIFKVTHFSWYSHYILTAYSYSYYEMGSVIYLFLLKYIMGIVSHQFTRCHHWCLLIVYTVQHTRLPDIMLKCNIIIVIVTSY